MNIKLLSTVISIMLISCSDDGPILDKSFDENMGQSKENTKEILWDTILCNQISANELFIGNQYLGIQNWNCNGNPPNIFPGAVFHKSSFAVTFDKEVVGKKNPVEVYSDFSDPYISEIIHPSGSSYQLYLKDMLKSEEYSHNNIPKLHIVRFANVKSVDCLKSLFVSNPTIVNALTTFIKQEVDNAHLKNCVICEIIYRGFTLTADITNNTNLFVDEAIDTVDLVYVKSITYGACAYLVVLSDMSYEEVKTISSNPSLFDNINEKLQGASVFLITNSTPTQNASLYRSFDALRRFMSNPYQDGYYGYPIYCIGCNLEDNSFFHK